MRILVDTHAVLWYQANDPKLTHAYREIMENSTNHCYVSIVSLWEIALKSSIGKLPLNMLLRAFFATIERAGFTTQTLNPYHLLLSAELPMHHRDPFDRMLIAQAKVEGMQILTADPHNAPQSKGTSTPTTPKTRILLVHVAQSPGTSRY